MVVHEFKTSVVSKSWVRVENELEQADVCKR